MRPKLVAGLFALLLAVGAAGCTGAAEDDSSVGDSQDAITAEGTSRANVVRSYYAATRTADPAAALAGIVDDRAILSAPSVKLLKGVSQVEGKDAFVKAVAGGSFLIGGAMVREVIPQGDLVVARIDLPLPNGDVLTQVEFFQIRNGKIARLDSYYDSVRFIAALPAIALDRLKHALGMT
jgi:hypothetical protein